MPGRPARPVVAALALVALAATACGDLLKVPILSAERVRFRLPQTSVVLSADGSEIAELHAREDRRIVALDQTSRRLREAVVAVEDRRFFEHTGADLAAIARAAYANLSSGEVEQGGSTITQQLVRNTLIDPDERTEDTVERKLDEIALARQLERRLSKQEILEAYLNTVYFGRGAYGVQAATQTYFGARASEIGVAQAALLAGLISSPNHYDPYRHPRRARQRRAVVLRIMAQLGYLRESQARRLARRPLGLGRPERDTPYPAAYFVDYVKRLLLYDPRFHVLGDSLQERQRKLLKGGLRIHTTLDPEAQVAAEEAIDEVLLYEDDPYGAVVALDPRTGAVRAMVGGRNFFAPRAEDPFAKVNLAIVGEPGLGRSTGPNGKGSELRAPGTGRQAGSAFKPFALATALDEGVSLSSVYEADSCMTFPHANAGGEWEVCNYEESAYGGVSLLDATVNSINVVYAQLILDVGAEDVVETAREMGISTRLSEVPSAALGTNPVNPLGMASAFGALATNGMRRPPVAVTKITNGQGTVIYRDATEAERVLDPTTAYLVTSALQGVIESGTGTGANIGRTAAGKTGTAQEYRDAWFVGYTPSLVAAAWVGYPEGSIEMKTYCETGDPAVCRPTRTTVTGGSWPASIWRLFMLDALAGVPDEDFEVPEGATVSVTIDVRTGCLAGASTPEEFRATEEYALGTEPTATCAYDPEPEPDERGEKGGEGREKTPPGHDRGDD
ncbi:MAG: transglycosylase domain-containing protein [Actinomycetota bacterium]